MAKKRKREVEEDAGFEFPDFDEEDFLRKELAETKATLVVLLFAVVIAVISFIAMFFSPDVSTGAYAGTAIGLGAALGIKFLFGIFNVKTGWYDWKKWAGNIGLYLLTWLAIWILLCNPPISDFAGPAAENLEVKSGIGNWTAVSKIQSGDIAPGSVIRFRAKVTDNVNLEQSSVKISLKGGNLVLLDGKQMTKTDNDYFESPDVTIDQAGTYTITITARDARGNTSSFSQQLVV